MKKNIIIGLVVILGLGLLYWGIEFLKGVNLFEPTNYYLARFEKINGLNVSSPITVNGYQVGLVEDMKFDFKTNEIEVKMRLDNDLKIPVGSSVSLSSEFLGGSSLILNLTKAHSYHKVGDLIPSETKMGLMDKVGNDIMPQINEIMPKINDILTNVNALTSNPALHNSVSDFDNITSQLSASAKDLSILLKSLNSLSQNLNGSVPGVINGVDGTLNNIQTLSSNLNTKVNDLPTQQLQTTINDLNATLANLKSLTAELNQKLNDRNSSLGLLLNDRQLYDNANGAVMSLDSLLTDIKANPKRYITIKVF